MVENVRKLVLATSDQIKHIVDKQMNDILKQQKVINRQKMYWKHMNWH